MKRWNATIRTLENQVTELYRGPFLAGDDEFLEPVKTSILFGKSSNICLNR